MAEPEEIAREESVAAEPAAASPRQPEPSTRPVSRPSRFERYVRRVISGSILADAEVQKHYPYVLFMAVLMFLYIANGFHTQKLHRQRAGQGTACAVADHFVAADDRHAAERDHPRTGGAGHSAR